MTYMERMTFINLMGNDSTSVCPKCGSSNCADFDTPYWSKCMDCGFESMASEDPGEAQDAWVHGYADIEDKAQDVGINGLTDKERLDLWWHENGMWGCVDMGMSVEEADAYWESNPAALMEECTMMWKALGY